MLFFEGEDCGFLAFMDSVDVLVMGRNTYEQVLSFGEWPYGDTKVVVLSRKSTVIPDQLQGTVSTTADSPKELIERLSAEGAKHVYVDGGKTIQSFLTEGLINEITTTVIPVILGSGITLFGPVPSDVKLKHISTQAYSFGFVQNKYCINN
jgi:dihydrofolate reductase